MAHTLIIGMSESGKTSLAKILAAYMRGRGIKTMALDPLCDPSWPVDFITKDQAEFLRVYWASRGCAAFMDEGGESVGRYNLAMQQTATKGRHWGHANYYIAQKATQLAPVVRDMCSVLFAFSMAPASAKMLAEDFNNELLLEAPKLQQFEYIYCPKFGRAHKSKLTRFQNGQSIGSSGRVVSGRGTGDSGNADEDEGGDLAGIDTGTDADADTGPG